MSILSGLSAPIATTVSQTAAKTVTGTEETDETANAAATETDAGTASAAESASAAATNADISEQFDTFLTLLTAQIKNQDPLAPLDSTQFVEQLATFSNLELQAEGNQTLESIASMLAANLYRLESADEAAS